ncbi:MAG: hypothetical protein EOP06_25615, partial [Proteobacteria bacterium]
MRLMFLILVLVGFARAAQADIFIGNAGDVIQTGEGTYLYDLYSIDEHRNPFFGAEIDPELPSLPLKSNLPFSVDSELLARKLTDANRLLPGLGDSILAALKSYYWRSSAKKGEPEYYSAEASRFKAAARNGGTISVSAPLAEQLDQPNRVALLFHEAISSLLLPTLVRDKGSYQQEQRNVVEIVGWL